MLIGQIDQHIAHLFHQEGDTPFKEIHLLWQVEWVRDIFILFNVHFIVFDKDNCSLVMILATVIWRAENCDYRRESLMSAPTVHFVAINLNLMGANDRNEVILSQDLFDWVQSKFDRALSLDILAETELAGFAIFHWIGPKQITEESMKWRLNKSVNGIDIRFTLQFRRDATVHA